MLLTTPETIRTLQRELYTKAKQVMLAVTRSMIEHRCDILSCASKRRSCKCACLGVKNIGAQLLMVDVDAFCVPPISPVPPPSSTGWSGNSDDNTPRSGLLRRRLTFWLCRSQKCLSTWPRSGSCEFMRKPDQPSNAGNLVRGGGLGAISFGYFSWQDKKSD